MATLNFDGVDDRVNINPLSTSLNNVPNGAATMALLLTRAATTTKDLMGIRGGNLAGSYYHGLRPISGNAAFDDDGIVGVSFSATTTDVTGTTGDDFFICGLDWPSGGAALERIHASTKISTAQSWDHGDSDAVNGGNRAGPGTGTGYFHIGDYDAAPLAGNVALVAVWNLRFTDTDWTNLWVNKKTSDWYNHPAGIPKTLIELTSTSPVDIGSDPVSSIALVGGLTASGPNPTGWTFDGRNPPIPATDYSNFPKYLLAGRTTV